MPANFFFMLLLPSRTEILPLVVVQFWLLDIFGELNRGRSW